MIFGRHVYVDIGQPGATSVRLQGLRIAFHVVHARGRTPSTASVSVWGVRPETVSEAQRAGALVRVAAGYEDSLREIFVGRPVKDGVALKREAPERVLTLECTDGGVELQEAFTAASWSTETDGLELLDQLAADLGVPRGAVLVDPSSLRFPTRALAAPTAQVLDEVTRLSGALWAIRDGALVVYPGDGSTGETAPVYSVANRTLVGTPAPKDQGRLEVRVLLDSSMRPGKPFRVQSEQVTGDYVAERVDFQGDSGFDNSFYATITGRRRPAPRDPATVRRAQLAAQQAAAARLQAAITTAGGG